MLKKVGVLKFERLNLKKNVTSLHNDSPGFVDTY